MAEGSDFVVSETKLPTVVSVDLDSDAESAAESAAESPRCKETVRDFGIRLPSVVSSIRIRIHTPHCVYL